MLRLTPPPSTVVRKARAHAGRRRARRQSAIVTCGESTGRPWQVESASYNVARCPPGVHGTRAHAAHRAAMFAPRRGGAHVSARYSLGPRRACAGQSLTPRSALPAKGMRPRVGATRLTAPPRGTTLPLTLGENRQYPKKPQSTAAKTAAHPGCPTPPHGPSRRRSRAHLARLARRASSVAHPSRPLRAAPAARWRTCASLDWRASPYDSGMGGQGKYGASTAAAYVLPARLTRRIACASRCDEKKFAPQRGH